VLKMERAASAALPIVLGGMCKLPMGVEARHDDVFVAAHQWCERWRAAQKAQSNNFHIALCSYLQVLGNAKGVVAAVVSVLVFGNLVTLQVGCLVQCIMPAPVHRHK